MAGPLRDEAGDRPDARLAFRLAQEIRRVLGAAHPMTGALALSCAMAEHHLHAEAAVGAGVDLDRGAWLEDSLDQSRRLLEMARDDSESAAEAEEDAAAGHDEAARRMDLALLAADLVEEGGA